MIVELLTDQSFRELSLHYEPLYTEPADRPDQVFDDVGVMRKVATIRSFNETATA